MKVGKLTNSQLFKSVISQLNPIRDDVVLRPGIGEDCGGILFGDEICILSTDPITAAAKDIGRLGVHVSCNDVASSGAEPVGILVTIIAPQETKMWEIERITQDVVETANKLNVEVLGGHTEISDAVNRIILSTTVIGKASMNTLIRSSGAQMADDIVMTKLAAMEGTSIIVNDYSEQVACFLSQDEISEVLSFGDQISVVKEGLIARDFGVTSMHDITEGGILGSAWELAEASKYGIEIWLDDVPLHPVTKKICERFHLDPYRLISSGSMLITTPKGNSLVKVLKENNIQAALIGKIIPKQRFVYTEGERIDLEPPGPDELYKLSQIPYLDK